MDNTAITDSNTILASAFQKVRDYTSFLEHIEGEKIQIKICGPSGIGTTSITLMIQII